MDTREEWPVHRHSVPCLWRILLRQISHCTIALACCVRRLLVTRSFFPVLVAPWLCGFDWQGMKEASPFSDLAAQYDETQSKMD